MVTSDSLREALEAGAPDKPIDQAYIQEVRPVQTDQTMQEILPGGSLQQLAGSGGGRKQCLSGRGFQKPFLRTLHRTEKQLEEEAQAQAQ